MNPKARTIGEHKPRRSGVGARQVLVPGTNRAAPHPWRERLRAAMDGKPSAKDES